ncbi:MAG: flagellar hook protein FlgE [Deltaproteobacteria bacterium]|nr:flagellar hook protein FlgE [Deltaproteobacteria bacterium]
MRLESAFSASRGGLDSHGKAISVVGDNVANANTVGYKASRVEFADLMPLVPDEGISTRIPVGGGGVTIQRIRQIYEDGFYEFTGRTLDMAVDGNGFFMVGDAENLYLTRAGNFQISADGFLSNAEGKLVLGFSGSGTELGPIDMININQAGTPTTTAQISGNIDSASAVTTVPATPAKFSELQKAASFSASVDVYDSLGASHGIALYFFKTGVNEWTVQAYVDAGETGGEAGVPKQIGQAQIRYDTSGAVIGDATMNLQSTFTGAEPTSVAVDMANLTQMAATSQLSNVTRNGQALGGIQKYEALANGEIYAYTDSGTRILVGTVQLASVPNQDGLARAGSTLFVETELSGARTTGQPGTGGLGTLRGGSLEHSTVDISKEFVDLVLLQRGYQANSQVLNATNQLLRDTIMLMR